MKRIIFALTTALVTLGAACSLVIDTSGLDGANAGIDDAKESGAGDVSSFAPGFDGGGNGGNNNNDGSAFDGFAGDGTVSNSPCTTPHLFCDDFDDGNGTDLNGRWNEVNTQAGPVTLTTTKSISSPRALLHTSTHGDGVRASFLRKDLPFNTASGSVMTIAFDMRIERTSASGTFAEMDPFQIALRPTPTALKSRQIWFVVDNSSPFFQYFADPQDGGPNDDRRTKLAYSLDEWHHIIISLTRGKATMNLDGADHAVMFPDTEFDGISLYLGDTFASEIQTDLSFYYDNVVVDN